MRDALSPAVTLTEELLMLSFRRNTRKRQSRSIDPSGSLMVMFRASVVIELVELGSVELVRQQKRQSANTLGLRSLTTVPTGNAVRDALLTQIAEGEHSHKTLSWWLHDGNTMRAVTDDLVQRSLVAERGVNFGPFTRGYRFEPVDMQLDTAIRDRFEAVYYAAEEPTDRECLMAAIIYDANLWTYFGPLKGTDARVAFQSRMASLASKRRSPINTARIADDDVAAVLGALRASHSGGGH